MPQKKARRSIAITRRDLYTQVWAEPLSVLAKRMGVGGNALAKICDRLLVPYPTRGYWSKAASGKRPARKPLPPAPELTTGRVTISAAPASSRRHRTRLVPAERRDQLLDIAADIIRRNGLHAASMKRIASSAGISETQAYNYFRSREELFVLLAQRESERIQEARFAEINKVEGHYAKITVGTQVYLRQIDQRGGLMQMLLANPEVRMAMREQQRKINSVTTASHAINLVQLYGISRGMAVGATVVLSRLCLRAGKLIADRKIPLEDGERLCLAMVLQGSRAITGARNDLAAGTKGLEAA